MKWNLKGWEDLENCKVTKLISTLRPCRHELIWQRFSLGINRVSALIKLTNNSVCECFSKFYLEAIVNSILRSKLKFLTF